MSIPKVPAVRPGPAGGARAANRARRVEQICAAALPLFLEQGVETVTIDQIVDAAGVAKGSFYRYFDDKRQLVETMFAPLADAIRSAFVQCDAELAELDDPAKLPALYLR